MMRLERGSALEEDLNDYRLRFELLEGDRRAFKDQSERAIGKNREEINALRNSAKDMRDRISKLKKNNASETAAATEIDKLNHRVLELHKKSDEVQAVVRERENKIREMQNEITLSVQAHAKIEESSPHAKELRELENRLDKATIKYNEAQSMRKIYEDIIKAMQAEKLTFDTQLMQFERTLKVKKSDAAELEAISRDANRAKEFAKAELGKLELQLADEKKQRDKELQQKRELIRSKKAMDEKDTRKFSTIIDTSGASAAATQETAQTSPAKAEDRERRSLEMEEILRVIKQATGVASVEEVVSKVQTQADTHQHLLDLQRSSDLRLAELRQKRLELVAELGESRYSGDSASREAQRAIEEFETHLEGAARKMAESRVRADRQGAILRDITQGTQTLYSKLHAIRPDLNKVAAVSESNIHDALQLCAQKLEELQAHVHRAKALRNQKRNAGTSQASTTENKREEQHQQLQATSEEAEKNAAATDSSRNDIAAPSQETLAMPTPLLSQAVLSPYNIRIGPRPSDFDSDNDDDLYSEDENSEVLDRDAIKKFAAQRKRDAAGKKGAGANSGGNNNMGSRAGRR